MTMKTKNTHVKTIGGKRKALQLKEIGLHCTEKQGKRKSFTPGF